MSYATRNGNYCMISDRTYRQGFDNGTQISRELSLPKLAIDIIRFSQPVKHIHHLTINLGFISPLRTIFFYEESVHPLDAKQMALRWCTKFR